MNTLPEMTGDRLHWRILLKYIKSQVKAVGGFVRERDILNHFVPEGLRSSAKQQEMKKVIKALEGLYIAGWCSVSLGQTATGVGRVVTLLKYPTGMSNANQQYSGDDSSSNTEGL